MKLLVKKTTPKKAAFTAINDAALKQVKGGNGDDVNPPTTDDNNRLGHTMIGNQ